MNVKPKLGTVKIIPKGSIWIASFDPGTVNFAFIIEEFNLAYLNTIILPPKKLRYKSDGTPTRTYGKAIDKICVGGKTILVKNINLTLDIPKMDKKAKNYLHPNIFINFIEEFDRYGEYWDKCSIFLIEQQMQFKQRRNIKAIKMAQHCRTYFTMRYLTFKIITEYPSYHKTQVIGCKKGVTKHYRKAWSTRVAKRFLEKRGDMSFLEQIKSKAKQDDICDCLVQLQSFKIKHFIENNFQFI